MKIYKIYYEASVAAVYVVAKSHEEAWDLLSDTTVGNDTDQVKFDVFQVERDEIAANVHDPNVEDLEELTGEERSASLLAMFPERDALTDSIEARRDDARQELLEAAKVIRDWDGWSKNLTEPMARLNAAIAAVEEA